jgi:hypothetical protein
MLSETLITRIQSNRFKLLRIISHLSYKELRKQEWIDIKTISDHRLQEWIEENGITSDSIIYHNRDRLFYIFILIASEIHILVSEDSFCIFDYPNTNNFTVIKLNEIETILNA